MKSVFSVCRKALMALAAVTALLLTAGPAFAQSVSRGKVLDSNGEPIIGASVVVHLHHHRPDQRLWFPQYDELIFHSVRNGCPETGDRFCFPAGND